MKCRNVYELPLKKKHIQEIIRRKSPAHKGLLKHSIDFEVPEGTPVYAAASGTVVWLRNSSKVGGPLRKYWFCGNRIVIKHKNKEYTAYEHMKYKGIIVKKGQRVRKGQLIGISGNTGYSFGPHLHFEVFSNPSTDESEGSTLQVSLKDMAMK